ncbi:hypothetical protein RJT34_12952 [Clitoria ternatea]|uniref:Uncharacterized protein n=1 Tax=Clitoria ternatea TaxID=43366 RepID=A0AAN9PL97_CLITE
MAGLMPAELSNHGASDGNSGKISKEKQEETLGRWYMSRKEIEENSPSRKDGIDLKKDTYLHKSYCTFLQDLGMRLKVEKSPTKHDPLKEQISIKQSSVILKVVLGLRVSENAYTSGAGFIVA